MSGIMSMVLGAKTAIAAAVDAYFNLVTLLLPGDGTNGAQNNTFIDSSTNNFTITRNGNTTQGTFSPFSQTGWSNFFDGSGDYISMPSATTALALGSGDWTIECFVNVDNLSSDRTILDILDGNSANRFIWRIKSTGVLAFQGSNGTDRSVTTSTVSTNTWVHLAICKASSVTRIFIGGTQGNTNYSDTNTYANSGTATIGVIASDLSSAPFLGYISNFRVVKGSALYTSNFTPPTATLTAVTNTSLLTCQSNRFIDNSTNALSLTIGGNVSVQAFSPFAPTAAYSAATNGGSGYFDGSGDYLQSSGDFFSGQGTARTFQCWIYVVSMPGAGSSQGIFSGANSGGNLSLRYDSSGYLKLDNIGTVEIATSGSGAIKAGQWTHVAVTRTTGNLYTLYVNGSSVGSGTNSTSMGSSTYLASTAGGSTLNGYMSGVRVTNTVETISVPTAPSTAISGTALLLNFTNAGITDATAKNVLETVGNAQISTTQSKFGGSSMYFDGTGDRLYIPDGKGYVNGTEPFTLECWVYLGGTPNYWTIFGSSSGSGLLFTVQNLTTVIVNPSGAGNTLSGTTSLTAGTWFHLALTRNSSNRFDIWVNGVSVGNATSSQSFGTPTHFVIGAADNSGGQQFNGYLDDVRISKFCRYTTTFTPPTAAFALQ